ncbi:hypothetical protein JW916_13685 [Candidatus Sumerlaeota bacterium]|nr:hypothetical protein [Candidatus Sumerlaeota bacterium]
MSAGQFHGIGLKADGSIVAWGGNDFGECDVPAPNASFVAVASGSSHNLGLKSDGSIAAWGRNDYGQCNVPVPNADFVAVAGGVVHTLGLKADGSIIAWGLNDYGQCNVPAPNTDFVAAAAGYSDGLGLKSDGSIAAWGRNDYGQCNVPAPNTGFVGIAAGSVHCLGLKSDGSIVAWGRNDEGQCDVPLPNSGFAAVAAGGYYSLGLKTDRSIVAWGRNDYGVCSVPAPNTGFLAIAAGDAFSLALNVNPLVPPTPTPTPTPVPAGPDGIVAWGDNGSGQCSIPPPNENFIDVSAGYSHSLGLRGDGSIRAWGSNDFGQCDVPLPNTGYVEVAAGGEHSLGRKSDGSIVAWGRNEYGECDLPTPNTGFAAVSAGYRHSLGLRFDGSIVAWGYDFFGPCNVPAPNRDFVALSAGGHHSLGLKNDGSIVAWGSNVNAMYFYHTGQCDVPFPNTDYEGVAGGWEHSLGLKTDGSIVAWGSNNNGGALGGTYAGQCDVPEPNADFIDMEGGKCHSVGLKSDGSIVAWGDNSYGQCNVPAPNTGFAAVTAGFNHCLGLKRPGRPVAPKGLHATSGPNAVVLSWNPNIEADLAGYYVYRDTSVGGSFLDRLNSEPTKTTFHVDSDTTVGQTYYYTLSASNTSDIESRKSTAVWATAGSVVVTMPDYRGAPGTTATLQINCDYASGIAGDGMNIQVTYDKTVLTPIAVLKTPLTEDFSFTDNIATADGRVDILGSGAPGAVISGEGHLLDVQFLVAPGADLGTTATHTFFNIDMFDGASHALTVDYTDTATLTVALDYILGDVTGDGAIDAADILMAMQAALGQIALNTLEFAAANVNGDGRIDSADVTLIQRLAMGLPITPPPAGGGSPSGPFNPAPRAAEAETYTVGLPELGAEFGQVLSIPVSVSNTAGIAGASLTINYDPMVLRLDGAATTTLTGDFAFRHRIARLGVAKISLSRATSLGAGPGEIAVLRFTVMGATGRSTPLVLAQCKLSGEYGENLAWKNPVTVASGSVDVQEPARSGAEWMLY